MWTAVTLIVGMAILAGLIMLLYDTVRFSIISPLRTRGARARLRYPAPRGIHELTGFAPPAALVEFYRTNSLVELVEFYLVDHSKTPPAVWAVGGFSPLTALDVREELAICHGVPGIPIADDMQKGTYFIVPSGAVMLDSPNVAGRRIEVAPGIAEFAAFQVQETDPRERT